MKKQAEKKQKNNVNVASFDALPNDEKAVYALRELRHLYPRIEELLISVYDRLNSGKIEPWQVARTLFWEWEVSHFDDEEEAEEEAEEEPEEPIAFLEYLEEDLEEDIEECFGEVLKKGYEEYLL